MTIINATPHDVHVLNDNNEVIQVFPKSNVSIRLSSSTVRTDSIASIPTSITTFSKSDVPEYSKHTYYIVSQLIKNAFPNRTDFLVPAEVVRDENNNVIGCKSLGR